MGVPNLQMFREDIPTVEVGTEVAPIDFGLCMAGDVTALPYGILLYNDKTGALDSVPARNIGLELVRLELTETHVSTGVASQTYTLGIAPIFSYTVTVDGEVWARVTSLVDYGQYSKVYTLDLTTGELIFGDNIHGMVPPNGEAIDILYAPDTAVYGKDIITDSWVSYQSSGVVEEEIDIASELATKLSNTSVQVVMCPKITVVVGVWDNVGKTGTNYYTGGSFNEETGVITLGVSMSAPAPYVEYSYKIADDVEAGFTPFVQGELYELSNPLPQKNAKKLYFKATIPAAASTQGGVNLKMFLRASYLY
jgi:hypothetical protein